MNFEDFLIVTNGQQGKHCTVTTTALSYSGIYLCTSCPQNKVSIKLKITDDFKDVLINVSDDMGNFRNNKDIVCIPIELIKNIEFDDECNY